MKKLVKLPLPINGELCKSIDDLKENFNIYDVLEHFSSGKLEIWLRSRKFLQLEPVQLIKKELSKKEIAKQLYEIFEVKLDSDELLNAMMVLEYQENYDSKNIERKEVLAIVSRYTKEIVSHQSIIPAKKDLDELKGQRKVGNYFVSDLDGIAIDTKTNLMWTRFSLGEKIINGQLYGQQKKYSWHSANLALDKFNGYLTHLNWRIPSLDELLSLNVNKEVFLSNSEAYWSTAASHDHAYIVNFNSNRKVRKFKRESFSVILVRDNNGK